MKLTSITFTGIDEHTDLEHVEEISQCYPYVEWGVLLSYHHKENGNRYPDPHILDHLDTLNHVRLAAHICGGMAKDVVTAICSIGDENVTFVYHAPSAALGDAQASLAPHSLARGFTYPDGYRETERFADIVEQARLYIMTDCGGSFERFAEWGLVRPLAQV